MRIAINGFGRIGRCLVRAFFEMGYEQKLELTAINCSAEPEMIAYFLKYDSVHGRFDREVTWGEDWIQVANTKITTLNQRDPQKIDWAALGVELVMECTGKFKSRDEAGYHLDSGAKRVIISAPAAKEDATIVYGINHQELDKGHQIISAGSCTTNCFIPILAVLQQFVGIKNGFMTTVHSYTNDQNTLDCNHQNPYRSRACGRSIIPTGTGAGGMIAKLLPELEGKIGTSALRVPSPNVSLVDFCFNSKKKVTAAAINNHFRMVSQGELKDIIGYTAQPLVSVDFNHDSHSAIFDSMQTQTTDGELCKVSAWYDNEWAFSARMLDIAKYLDNLN